MWELHGALRLDDGHQLVQIPLAARFRKAVWDYLDEHQRQYEQDKEAHRQRICAGRVGTVHGLDGGAAAMVALDDWGGQAAMLGAELVRQTYCDDSKSPEAQALGMLGAVAGLRGHGPLRARLPLHGAYEANVMIEGVKKNAKSSFFPRHWTTSQVEAAIDEAYQGRAPAPRPGRFRGKVAHGMVIEMDVDSKGQIQTAYPIYQGTE